MKFANQLDSDYRPLCAVNLPFNGRQKYMHSFDLGNPVMAEGYWDYWEPVCQLITAAGATKGIAHMTVDEKIIPAGQSQRRPKPHVDGCYMPERVKWGGGAGAWNHAHPMAKRMAVIVAASVPGCRAWRGTFMGVPKEDGDLSHLDLDKGEVLPANQGYLLSPDCIHESMVLGYEVKRTFLRIALPLEFEYEPTTKR